MAGDSFQTQEGGLAGKQEDGNPFRVRPPGSWTTLAPMTRVFHSTWGFAGIEVFKDGGHVKNILLRTGLTWGRMREREKTNKMCELE